jgi:predicted nucleic acid-binding protein
MVYALDTNIVILYLHKEKNVFTKFHNVIMNNDDLVIPRIVHYELQRGFLTKHSPKMEDVYMKLIGITGCCEIAGMNEWAWTQAEQVYKGLYEKRLTVGELDILIAAICLENNYTLVTNNEKHFKDIDGLRYENWVNG